MSMRRKLIAGNWKMNGSKAQGLALVEALAAHCREAESTAAAFDLLVCPPFVLLPVIEERARRAKIAIGGQDCHPKEAGAHTGDISATMLADVGCSYVIVGHSERRQDHREDDALVQAKASAALAAGLKPIVCVGETQAERDAGQALSVIEKQVRNSLPAGAGSRVVIAYEPVWAIGTGLTATPQDVADVHAAIRAMLQSEAGEEAAAQTRILYGGSVKPSNAAELLALQDVDGALVGGASLKAEDFWAIACASVA
ncbi:MAG TPA: triose-phosphate isomerase [Kiloniellales bacterium]|nr:triose-phosphate isomerase [Kiloniellales bacterium]